MIGIYKITNPNGKVYIGQSVDIKKRWKHHQSKSRYLGDEIPLLYRSIRKYGVHNHTFQVLEECNVNVLNERERFYQDKYNSVNEGLNCVSVKTEDRSGKMNEETRAKMRKSHTGLSHTKETKEKIRNAHLGIIRPHMVGPVTEEHKLKISQSKIGKKRKPFTEEWKMKISKTLTGRTSPMKGRKHSQKTKKKISDALSGEKNPRYGKTVDEKTKQKISEANRRAWKNKGDDIKIHNSISVKINGIEYKSILQASKKTGISPYKIKRYYL